MIPLGAINKKTREYVYPKNANKKDEYCCPECDKDLILHQGNIRIHHFVHKFTESEPCNYYTSPTESQIHRAAKLLLKTLLDKKEKISFIRKCCCCKKDEEFEIPETTETTNIQLEYRFEYDGPKIADVAYIENGEIVCIFEICHTHKTQSENRPEPWFEIDALSLIHNVNNAKNTSIKINCIRCEKCEECIQLEKDNIEKKERATDILYNWLKTGIEISPFMYWNHRFESVEKNAKCTFMDDVFDLIISEYIDDSDDKYQRYCIRLVYGSTYYFTKVHDFEESNLGVYYLDIDWVLSQQKIPEKIKYIASLDYYDKETSESLGECIKCRNTSPFYIKRIKNSESNDKVFHIGCSGCNYLSNKECVECFRCKNKYNFSDTALQKIIKEVIKYGFCSDCRKKELEMRVKKELEMQELQIDEGDEEIQIRKTLEKIQIERQIKIQIGYEETRILKEIQKQELIRKEKEEKEKQELIRKKQKQKEMEEMVNQITKLDIPAYWWDK